MSEDIYTSMYDTPCVGGCGNFTNGSQYCCKTYCINEFNNSSSDNDENHTMEIETEIIDNEIIKYLELIDKLDFHWNEIENKSNMTRPADWYLCKL